MSDCQTKLHPNPQVATTLSGDQAVVVQIKPTRPSAYINEKHRLVYREFFEENLEVQAVGNTMANTDALATCIHA